jgi:DNA-binding MurR/RpiR family transcriptional regulator
MKRFNQIAMPDDLVIIFSVTNSVPQLATAAKLARERGATVVSCCCKSGTLLEKNSDIAVIGYTQLIVSKKGFENSSNLGLQIIARTIVEYLSIE